MKLKELWIDNFKNINELELDFSSKNKITVLIGNNGSGKSNILEAISSIFFLLSYGDLNSFNGKFEIKYEINEHEVLISKKTKLIYKIRHIDNKTYKNTTNAYIIDNNLLPNQVIALYSGEELRLWNNFYKKSYLEYSKGIRFNQIEIEENQKMLYVNKYYWDIALLTMFASSIKVDDIISIKKLSSIKISFNKKTLEKFIKSNPNRVTDINNKLSQDKNEIEVDLDEFNDLVEYESHKRLFNILAASYLPESIDDKIISKIELVFEDGLSTKDLSEGEKKKILIKLVTNILGDQDSLLLLDEPDSYLHVANKSQVKDLISENDQLEVILTTHSPTLTHVFDDRHIIMINNGKNENKNKQEIFSYISNGIWNYQEQSIFLSSMKNVILLVEGKHDQIHIKEAFSRYASEYNTLSFDIFQMNGESNIKHMLLGLINNGVDFNDKKIIAIFDNDKAGKDSFKNNFKAIQDKNYKRLVDNNGNESNTFFGLLLPKKENFANDFTIENMYTGEKFKNAMNKTFQRRIDSIFFENFVDDISKQIKEDAKNQLADDCTTFDNTDFNHFKKLFDLIIDIKDNTD